MTGASPCRVVLLAITRGEEETVNIEEKSESEELAKIRVELTVTEELIYDFPITLEVPPEVADDIEALTSHLA